MSNNFITIVRGDDTNFNGASFLTINLVTEILDLSSMKALFTLGNITKTFDDISSGSITINLTSQETSNLPTYIYGTLKLIDSTNKIATIESVIPFSVISQVHGNAIATEPYTLNFDVKQNGETILNVNVESAVSVQIGATTTLPAGSNATVANVGTDNHLILDFGIPQGIQGEQGKNATITGATASVNNTVGTPSVNVTTGGTEFARSFDFAFSNLKGEKGDTGSTGATGNGITNITKTSTSGLIDTYTISYTNGDSSTYTIANGKDGRDGVNGTNGQDGQAATITVGTTTTGEAGTNASVTNSGTSSNAVFNFTIPQGEKGEQGDDYVITQSDYASIATIVENDIAPTLANKQNITDNSLTTTNKTIIGAINEVDSIAKGANQALSYGNYSTMITAFNALDDDVYKVGQNVMIVTLNVPDLWISGIESTSSTYTYTTDEAFTTELNTNGYVQVGYYKLSALETQKVDLTNYATKNEKADIIQNEKTGSIVQIVDGANNLNVNNLVATIELIQDLHGYNSPWAGGEGKNLLDPSKVSVITAYGLTITFSNNVFSISGTPTAQSASLSFNFVEYSDYSLSGKNYAIQAFEISGTPIKGIYGFRTEQEKRIAIIFDSIANPTINTTFKLSVSTTSQTAWSPYENICPITGWTGATISQSGEDTSNPTTRNISWQSEAGIIYGGTLDVISGVLTVTDQNIASYNGENLPSTWISDRDAYSVGETPTIGAQVVYKLETPITYQLTPLELKTLLGTNNFWANTGDILVEYRADTKNYIDSNIPNLTNYVTFDDYATSTTTGVVMTNAQYGVSTSSYTKNITATTKTYAQYQSGNNAMFVGKGTLENVIIGKNLESANNKTTTISSSSTDNEYPSAKAVYDYIQSLNGDEVSY